MPRVSERASDNSMPRRTAARRPAVPPLPGTAAPEVEIASVTEEEAVLREQTIGSPETIRARQGISAQGVRYVLAFGIGGVVTAFIILAFVTAYSG